MAREKKLQPPARYRSGYFRGTHDLQLFYRCWDLTNPKANIIRVHGFGSHGGRGTHVAKFFLDNTINFSAYDQRGHGLSDGRPGYVNTFEEYLRDLDRFIQLVHVNEVPTFLLGSSMGGLVSVLYTLKHPDSIKGVIATAPFLRLGSDIVAVTHNLRELEQLAHVHPTAEFRLRSPVELTPEADTLMHDTMTINLFVEILNAQKIVFEDASHVQVACLLLQGGADTVADPSGAIDFFHRIESADKKLIIYGARSHTLLGDDTYTHFVLRDISNWIDQHLID